MLCHEKELNSHDQKQDCVLFINTPCNYLLVITSYLCMRRALQKLLRELNVLVKLNTTNEFQYKYNNEIGNIYAKVYNIQRAKLQIIFHLIKAF